MTIFQLERARDAPQRARAIVAECLRAEGCGDLVDVARLLVTELVTNAVVHAASAPEVEVTVDARSATITVRDADTGPIVRRRSATELDEGGRGILLVDRLADAWGTEHRGGRKSVWFRLSRDPDSVATDRIEPGPAPPEAAVSTPRLADLLLRPLIAASLGFEERVAEILERVMAATAASGATLALTDRGTTTVARGTPGAAHRLSHDLLMADRVLGTLTVHTAHRPAAEVEAFVTLAAERLALLAAQERWLQDERQRTNHVDFLAEAGDLLAGSLDVTLTLTLATRIAVPQLATWCAAYRVDERGRAVRCAVAHEREEAVDATARLLDDDAGIDAAIRAAVRKDGASSPVDVKTLGADLTISVAPLSSRGRLVGLLVLGGPAAPNAADRMLLHDVARRVAVAVDNAQLHEHQSTTAAALQSSLLPPPLPAETGFELAARYHAASPGLMVGGDFYDAFTLPGGATALVLGDVCGKGAEAAALTGTSRDALRLLLRQGQRPIEALRTLNRLLVERNTYGRFCTIAVAILSRDGADATALVCLAGHPEPVVLRPDGTCESVGEPGQLLGVLPDDELVLHEVEVALGPDDLLVLYTDGVTERRDGPDMFGVTGLQSALAAVAGQAADVVAQHLEDETRSFVAAELRDDIAILVARPSAQDAGTATSTSP